MSLPSQGDIQSLSKFYDGDHTGWQSMPIFLITCHQIVPSTTSFQSRTVDKLFKSLHPPLCSFRFSCSCSSCFCSSYIWSSSTYDRLQQVEDSGVILIRHHVCETGEEKHCSDEETEWVTLEWHNRTRNNDWKWNQQKVVSILRVSL